MNNFDVVYKEYNGSVFVNLTPHSITLKIHDAQKTLDLIKQDSMSDNDLSLQDIPADLQDVYLVFKSVGVARIQTSTQPHTTIDGILIVKNSYGVIQLPDGDYKDKILIVSLAFKDKADDLKKLTGAKMIVAPDTSPQSAIRDDKGNIVAVRQFVLLA